MKRLFAYFDTGNKFNSVYQQTMLLIERLELIYGMKIEILDDEGFKSHLNKDDEVILLPYYTLKLELSMFQKYRNVVFIYHNITPPRFFWKTEPLVAVRSVLGHLQLRYLRHITRQWIAVSEYNKRELESYGFRQVQFCSNLIKVTQSVEEKTPEPSMLYVGRIVQNKKCLELLEMAHSASQMLGRPVSLYLVGSGKEGTSYLRRFREWIDTHSEAYLKIHWLNGLSEAELAGIYQRCWLYVTLSQHEGFGLPVCESINNGTPAIYVRCGGQELVLNNLGLTEECLMAARAAELLGDASKLQALFRQQKELVEGITIPNYDNEIRKVFDGIL